MLHRVQQVQQDPARRALLHTFGQGPGVEICISPKCRRRLHTVRSGDGHNDRDWGRATSSLRCDDAREGQLTPDCSAAVLYTFTTE